MNLQLSLKTKWFEMTKAGIKTEDYRQINEYWIKRLLINPEIHLANDSLRDRIVGIIRAGFFKPFKTNTMTLGYPKSTDTERIIKFEHAGIEIAGGNPEWGADPDILYFVIKHGKKL